MLRRASSWVWSGASLLLLVLPGCLVSFNDYPLGDPQLPVSSVEHSAAGSASVSPNASKMGGSATGGASAAGGAAMTDSLPNPRLVDDFEDDDAAILERQGRSGAWYAANDGRGQQTPPNGASLLPSLLEPPRAGSAHGVHTFGGPFSTWGALIGTSFASSGNIAAAYDLRPYQGLRLWVRSGATSPTAAKRVRVNILTPATTQGGSCTICDDPFGVDVPLTAQWAQVEVPFSSLKQVGYGRPILTTPDLEHAMGVQFVFAINVSFDLWIDDIELY